MHKFTCKVLAYIFLFSCPAGYANLSLHRHVRLSRPSRAYGVTNPFVGDGLGAQYLRIIYAMSYAELHGLNFFYDPIKICDHNYDNNENYEDKIEGIFNIIGNIQCKNESKKYVQLNDHEAAFYFLDKMHFLERSRSRRILKDLFFKNKTQDKYFDPGAFNIAVHIRRPNQCDDRSAGPDIPDQHFLGNIEFIRKRYCKKNPRIHIFSQGDPKIFKENFKGDDLVFHINEDLEMTFCSMVFADVLCTSPSSLSYVAGYLSEGDVYYQPYPYAAPLPSWFLAPVCHAQNWSGLPVIDYEGERWRTSPIPEESA